MDPLLTDVSDRIGTVTFNRPQARNALDTAALRALPEAMAAMERDRKVDAVILTGADPAFCAGLDLKQLGSTGANLGRSVLRSAADGEPEPGAPWAAMTKPVIAAVNGPAVTGGLEIVLHCDLVVASNRAKFGDTHARVGVMPGWGLTVRLPQAVGVRKALEMSLTGNFLSAEDARRWGLANAVVPHHLLIPTARKLAADIAGNDQQGVRAMLEGYRQATSTTAAEGLRVEARRAGAQHLVVTPAEIERRRSAIVERGRSQT